MRLEYTVEISGGPCRAISARPHPIAEAPHHTVGKFPVESVRRKNLQKHRNRESRPVTAADQRHEIIPERLQCARLRHALGNHPAASTIIGTRWYAQAQFIEPRFHPRVSAAGRDTS